LARTCVFAKQSLGPILCGLPPQPEQVWQQREASLLPKLRDHYAEFLDHVSLVHLRLLASPTCVGLRYGRRVCSPESFSCLSTPEHLSQGCPVISSSRLGLPCGVAYTLKRPIHKAAAPSFQCPSPLQHIQTGREFQPVYHRLRLWGLTLGSASPCADCHGAGTLGFTVCGVFTRICAYSVRHPHFRPLHVNVCHGPFTVTGTLPYPSFKE
jgi:hypothetical protein